MAESAQAVEEQTEQTQEASESQDQTQAQSVELQEATDSPGGGPNASIDFLLDMQVPVTVTIGRREIPIQRLLQLKPGSVLKLDKPVDAPADLYLKDTKFATGNIVVVNDRFAVRIREIFGTGPNVNAKGN